MLLNQKIPFSFSIREIRSEAGLVFLFANVIFVLRHYFNLEVLSIPLGVSALIGTCISLLLAFRTNQAYERWWEARVVWGAIVNDSRTLIRQLTTFLEPDVPPKTTVGAFARRQTGWCYLLGQTLRGQPTDGTVRDYVPDAEQAAVLASAHRPLALLQGHAGQLRHLYQSGHLTDIQVTRLDATLTRLTDSMGRCERIKNTVFPKTYTFYLQAFIILFTAILPFGFVESLFFVEVPLVTLIASAFFLIEKSAIQLQDPFENRPTDTPMTAIADGIALSLRQLTGEDPAVKFIPNQTYFVL